MNSILVKDFMDSNPRAIHQHTPVRAAVESLIAAGLSGAPVIDDGNHVVGFISEQDCIKEMLNNSYFCDESQPVTTLMNTKVVTVSPDTSIVEVAERMAKDSPKNYPVVQQGRLVGMISRSRVLTALLVTSEDCYLHY
jgi:CBS domain-containing protein